MKSDVGLTKSHGEMDRGDSSIHPRYLIRDICEQSRRDVQAFIEKWNRGDYEPADRPLFCVIHQTWYNTRRCPRCP